MENNGDKKIGCIFRRVSFHVWYLGLRLFYLQLSRLIL
jgi:hypothetical protein